MKADFEPWWMFEEWETMVKSRRSFSTVNEAQEYFYKIKGELEKSHAHSAQKNDCFFAFWSDQEQFFCEGCDENLQLYHGIILMVDGKPSPHILRNNSNI